MQKLQTILTGSLLIAVVALYILHFTGGQKSGKKTPKTTNNGSVTGTQLLNRLAYIDLDTIQEKYTYFKQKNEELEREKKTMEAEVESGFKKLEQDRLGFINRGASITQVEAEQFQQELQNRYQQLTAKRENLFNTHMANQAKAIEQIQNKISAFLKEYNKDAGYQFIFSVGAGNLSVYYKDSTLNITNDVLEGLNADFEKNGKQ
jgi:outer membrane protein